MTPAKTSPVGGEKGRPAGVGGNYTFVPDPPAKTSVSVPGGQPKSVQIAK